MLNDEIEKKKQAKKFNKNSMLKEKIIKKNKERLVPLKKVMAHKPSTLDSF
jgi:hypothetical protein